MATHRICSIPKCGKPSRRRGWCGAHYVRWWRHGDPLAGGTPKAPKGEPLRFFAEVVLPYEGDECRPWPYACSEDGYGRITIDGKMHIVHRIVCEHVHGSPPTPDHEAAHSCGKGHLGCVNKRHLSWKTHVENMADMIEHGTHNRGERNNLAKLTEPQAREILALKGRMLQRDIAERFGVVQSNVASIHARRTWAWLD